MKITPNAPSKARTLDPSVKMIQWFDDHWYKINWIDEKGLPNEKFLASVTTKLNVTSKPFIAKWRGDVGNREADLRMFEAAERGKRLHAAWYTFCTGGLVIYNPWDRPQFTQQEIEKKREERNGNVFIIQYQEEMLHLVKLYKWVGIVRPEFLFCEKTVYSLTHGDAGTADSIVRINGGTYAVNGSTPVTILAGNYILDLKTGATVSDDAYLQTAAYGRCAEEMGLLKIDGTIILHTQSSNRKGIEGLATLVHNRKEMDEHYEEYRIVASLWDRKNKNAFPRVFEFPSMISMENLAA